MKKVRPDALWHKLSPEHRKTLDSWLFEEHLSYQAATVRAKSELGFTSSEGSVRRYYLRRAKERTVEKFTDLREGVAAVNGAPTDPKALRDASMKVMGGFLFQSVQQSPEDVETWAPVAQLLVQNDHNEVQREVKAEEHKVRREAMAFAKEKFRFETMKRALKALPQLQELAEAIKDPHAKAYEENRHWNRVRLVMFGPGRDVHPESPEEEAEMLAAKREREARREREAQMEREREKIMQVQPPPPSSPYYRDYIKTMTKRAQDNWEPGTEYEI